MLSILITIYNYNLLSLVKELNRQCLELNIEFEILTQDDASNSIFNIENEKINLLPNCNFVSLDKNIGLRENKNLLVLKSKFENLLIIDGDCIILNVNYIKDYLDSINGYDVVYGGRLHSKTCPSDNQKLRWKYGKFIEDKSLKDRLKTPHKSLLFNNTLIKKNCFNKVKFDSSFTKYGHDDTLFSFQLMKLNAKVRHIENPIQHNDIDTNEVFLKKTKGSLENLLCLYLNKKIDKDYSKLVVLIDFLKKSKLSILVSKIYLSFEKKLFENLESSNPNLIVFNFFRVGYLCSIKYNALFSKNTKQF